MDDKVYRQLYPEIEVYNSGFLQVSDIHHVFYEQVGNPKGKPILFIHGGGGNGCTARDRRFFDPQYYRAVLMDRRSLGRSKPFGEIKDNDTWKTVDDYERLRKHLGIKEWIIFGGSWGSALSLIYTEKYPDRVLGLVLRGVVLGEREELHYIYQEGASWILPEFYEKYVEAIPELERDNLAKAYYTRINSENIETRLKYAKLWLYWAVAIATIHDHEVDIQLGDDDNFIYLLARLDNNLIYNGAFFEADQENYIISNIDRIRHIPCVIVHGRYDIICPVKRAWRLHKNWPEASLRIICNAGHMPEETSLASAIITAIDEFRKY